MSIDSVRSGTLTANGNTAWFKHSGGRLAVSVQDEFDGGTATLQASFDEGTTIGTATDIVTADTISVAAGTDDVPYLATVELPACWLRWNLASSTSPSLDWKIEKVGY